MSRCTQVIQKDGKRQDFITQQYEVGLYVAVYDINEYQGVPSYSIADQFGLSEVTEDQFHEDLKTLVPDNGGRIL